jgi:molybdopterin molybdotransferase
MSIDPISVSNLISVQEAMRIIDAAVVTPRLEGLALAQATGRRLAEALRVDRDVPPFDKSLMDGYAVRAADLFAAPCALPLAGRVAAGQMSDHPLPPGATIAIMTGAPLPLGADAVVPIEQTRRNGEMIGFDGPTSAGRFVAHRASEAVAGAVALQAGVRLGPAQIAVGASVGAATVSVFAVPTVAVLGSGDELVDVGRTPGESQIRSCNNAMLMALLVQLHCQPVDLGTVPDEPDKLRDAIRRGLEQDVLLVSGGMSMGERDLVPGMLHELGGELRITKLRIKPGKPFVFAVMPGGKFVFGLPGNPVSAFVCTLCLASRLLSRMSGGPAGSPPRTAPLAKALEANGPRQFYQPAVWRHGALAPLQWKGSADIFTLAQADVLIVRPENHPPLDAATMVEFIEIRESEV